MERMNWDFKQTEFSKSILAGLFAGIAATILSLCYNIGFRYYSGYSLSAILNVSTIIFIVLLLATIAGSVFYVLHHYFKKGTLIYILISLIITIALFAGASMVQRSADSVLTAQFRELLSGIVLITGFCVVFMIPLLFRGDYL